LDGLFIELHPGDHRRLAEEEEGDSSQQDRSDGKAFIHDQPSLALILAIRHTVPNGGSDLERPVGKRAPQTPPAAFLPGTVDARTSMRHTAPPCTHLQPSSLSCSAHG
jgi:hypothetical protein